MRIVWSDELKFLAELTSGKEWRNDLEAVKSAGFKTNGQPHWQWYTSKVSSINYLREHKPNSGLTITETALEKYKSLNEQDSKKQELKKQYKKEKRAADKNSLDTSISHMVELVIPEKGYIGREDLCEVPQKYSISLGSIKPMESVENCMICDDPLAFYEKTVCIWCLKQETI